MKSLELSRYRLSAKNPLAPPDRRYRWAKMCHKAGVQPSFFDDRITWDLFRFLRKYEAAWPPAKRSQVLETHAPIAQAFDLHHGRMRPLRPVIEAYLSAGADLAVLASRLGVDVETVRWFAYAFYDVGHLHQAPLRVIHQIIGVCDDEGRPRLDSPRLWKLIGFIHKSEALDQLFNVTGGSTSKINMTQWCEEQTRFNLRLKQWLASRRVDPNDPRVADNLLKLAALEQVRRPTEDEPLNQNEQWAKTLLEEMPWAVGTDGELLFEGTEIGKHDASAAELRADELLQMAVGMPVTGSAELLDLKLPPPTKRKPELDGMLDRKHPLGK